MINQTIIILGAIVNREIDICIDEATWPRPPASPGFPNSFHTGTVTCALSVPATLLLIGYLTTPPAVVGVSLSEYWAWVRYLHAISPSQRLALSSDFSSLDAHQKTILSDDFGMGFPMHWLLGALDLRYICDGRYFIDFVAAAVGASSKKVSKRGPSKSPDFVSLDTTGRWHVIECKGTQSGGDYRLRQLGQAGAGTAVGATGAIAQKHTISFPTGVAGQRLACGLSIENENSGGRTSLLIVDPDEEDKFEVNHDSLAYADDALVRSSTARALRLSGFDATSSIIAAPRGLTVESRPTFGVAEERRREVIDKKRENARNEFANPLLRDLELIAGERMRGREAIIDLPKPVILETGQVRRVKVRQGFNSRALEELLATGLDEEPLFQTDSKLFAEPESDRLTTRSDDRHAQLRMGDIFVSEIEFVDV